jgi:drug/metabolite transporter (DMT)-like permease
VKYISSGLGAIIGSLFPLWVVIISLFKGERIASLAIKGICVCFIGICIVFYDYLGDFLRPDFRFGIFLSVTATLTWAFTTLYTKEKAASFNPYFSLGLQMMLSSTILFIGIGATGDTVPITDIPMISWLAIGYLVIFGSVLTFIAFIYSLQHLPPEVNSLYAYINPIIALIIGAIVFNEPFTILIVIGGSITLIGLYVVNVSIRRTKQDQVVIKKAAR